MVVRIKLKLFTPLKDPKRKEKKKKSLLFRKNWSLSNGTRIGGRGLMDPMKIWPLWFNVLPTLHPLACNYNTFNMPITVQCFMVGAHSQCLKEWEIPPGILLVNSI